MVNKDFHRQIRSGDMNTDHPGQHL